MARIRTVKPEFFTSEDIVALTPMARLLYVALWCEADREGRLVWKPRTFKMRYFPADGCDIDALARELIASGLAVLYGDGLAYIPSFARHQHINPREAASILPDPHASGTRADASVTVNDAQGGKEGKGKEGKEGASPTRAKAKTPIPGNFCVSERVKDWAERKGFGSLPERLEHFIGYAKRKDARYADWDEAFMSAIREDWAKLNGKSGPEAPARSSWL